MSKFFDLLSSMPDIFKEIEEEQEKYWSSLSKEDQLKVFCCVIRRLYQGELVDKGSYRYILYDVFGFDLESYAQAQSAGFVELHNSILVDDKIHSSKDR